LPGCLGVVLEGGFDAFVAHALLDVRVTGGCWSSSRLRVGVWEQFGNIRCRLSVSSDVAYVGFHHGASFVDVRRFSRLPFMSPSGSRITAKGGNGQLSFDGYWVEITRRGFFARVTVGKGDKRFPITSITAIRFRPGTLITKGFVQFSLLGDTTTKGNVDELQTDENAIILDLPKHTLEIKKVVDQIEGAMAANLGSQFQGPPSSHNSSEEIPNQTSKGISGYRLSVSLAPGADPVNVSVGILEVLLEESCRDSPNILSLEYDEIEAALKSGRALDLGEFQLDQYRMAKQTIEAVGGQVTAGSV